jgi:hypothetical protein
VYILGLVGVVILKHHFLLHIARIMWILAAQDHVPIFLSSMFLNSFSLLLYVFLGLIQMRHILHKAVFRYLFVVIQMGFYTDYLSRSN